MPKRFIDLDEALELFDADMNFRNWNGEVIGKLAHVSAFQKTAREKLLSLPLADVVERKKGRWLNKGRKICCSVCGRVNFSKPNFCDECGTDMREENTDD